MVCHRSSRQIAPLPKRGPGRPTVYRVGPRWHAAHLLRL